MTVHTPTSQGSEPRFICGWPLPLATQIDLTAAPGFLAWATCLHGLKRQAVYAALAQIKGVGPDRLAERLSAIPTIQVPADASPLFKIAAALRRGRPRAIIEAVFGSCPDGFRGALGRLSEAPLANGETYERLHALFATQDERANLLSNIPGRLGHAVVDAVLLADPAALVPSLFTGSGNDQRIKAINASLSLVRRTCSTVSDLEITDSLEKSGGKFRLRCWLDSFLQRRMDRLPYQISGDGAFEVLGTGPAIAAVGAETKTCIASRVLLVALGRVVHLYARERKVLVECRRLSQPNGWLASTVVGHSNFQLPTVDLEWALTELRRMAIPHLAGLASEAQALRPELSFFDLADDLNIRGIDEEGLAA